ncbi:MAG: hypothetical protein K5673_08760 [Lachnospiraceae bacterium]|nr:hypothetical protein [Lachnospiraceae bacterium]
MKYDFHRFSVELDRYMRAKGYRSVDKLLDANPEIKTSRETISRYRSGTRDMSEDKVRMFADLFGISPEYLQGKGRYRTKDDEDVANRNMAQLFDAFHKMICALGYADAKMDEADYNITFPPNTKAFIEDMKRKMNANKRFICNVNNDVYAEISADDYGRLFANVLLYINFMIEKTVLTPENRMPIPDYCSEDGGYLLHPNDSFETINGVFEVENEYITTTVMNES